MRKFLRQEFLPKMLRPFRHAASRTLLFLLVAVINPFEIVQWSEQRSHDLWQRVYAHCYPSVCFSQSPRIARGRDAVSLVYFDDASLERMHQTRPLPAFDLIDLIDDIRYAAGDGPPPRAIFVDMVLTDAAPKGATAAQLLGFGAADEAACASHKAGDGLSPFRCLLIHAASLTNYAKWAGDPHCQESTLAKLACIRRAGGLALLFADPRDRKGDAPLEPSRPSPALESLGTVAAVVPVSFAGSAYPLVAPSAHAKRAYKKFELFPAAALYASWCAAGGNCKAGPVEEDDLKRPAWSGAYDREIDVVWGIGSESELTRKLRHVTGGTLDQRCAVAAPGLGNTLAHLGGLAVSGLRYSGQQPCVYADAVPSDIFQAQITPEDAAAIVSGRLVLIGAQFHDSNDLVPAAPFGSLPGVYFHAMALDNLIEYGPAYRKPFEPIIGSLTWADPLNLLAIFLISLALASARQMTSAPAPAAERGEASRSAIWRAAGRRTLIVLGFAALMVLILMALTGGAVLVPDSFNLVAATIICIIGLGELVWDAIEPVRRAIQTRWPIALRVLFDPRVEPAPMPTPRPKKETPDEDASAHAARGTRAKPRPRPRNKTAS